ncbi:MAG: TRAP transporter small permease [Nannocystaceae bacterium]
MRKLRELEDLLIRAESALAVVLVLTMLVLAGYNVVYRNILVPLQQHWAHSGPPVEPAEPSTVAQTEPAAAQAESPSTPSPEAAAESGGGGDDFGGFGGGFGEDEPPAPDEPPASDEAGPAGDDFGGFGGGFGGDEPEPKPEPDPEPEPAKAEPAGDDFGGFGGGFGEDEPEPEPKPEPAAGDFGGFGGGFGDDEEGAAKPAADDETEEPEDEDEPEADDFGDAEDQFANLPSIDAAAETVADEGPQGGPPPAGSFAAWAVDFVDTIKLDWIDVFLRQLVIIVAFLGAMIATRRSKHINIDALSKAMPRSARRVIPVLLNLVSLGVCLVLASAGWDLVKISQEFPKDLVPWAQEWKFQLMFPIGFGLMAVHFAVRLLESIVEDPTVPTVVQAPRPAEPEPDGPEPDEPEPESDEPADADEEEAR